MNTEYEGAALAGGPRVLARLEESAKRARWGGRVKTVGLSEQPAGYFGAVRNRETKRLFWALNSLSTLCYIALHTIDE